MSCGRRSLTLESVERVCAGRRHSCVAGPTATWHSTEDELRSPRSLKEYADELFGTVVAPPERRKRAGSSAEGKFSLVKKIYLLKRPKAEAWQKRAKDASTYHLHAIGPKHTDVEAVVADVLQGFRANVGPVAVEDGTGGVYFLRTKAQRIVAVFKPSDEEPFAANNPKAHRLGQENGTLHSANGGRESNDACGIRRGIAPGSAAIREVAAFLLDRDQRAGVPPTTLLVAQHPAFYTRRGGPLQRKTGSLQLYVPHDCTADDVSESVFPPDRVHALAILDIRLANQDRHGGNVLALRRGHPSYDLIPIDHGACLPRITNMEETSFLWQFWAQAKLPFSAELRSYIAGFHAVRDAQALTAQLPSPYQVESDALLALCVCTVLLQVCVLNFDMTAFDVATLMCRDDPSTRSVLEELVDQTLADQVLNRSERWDHYAEQVTRVFETRLEAYLVNSRDRRSRVDLLQMGC